MVQYLRYMYNAVCVEYDLRHEVDVFVHPEQRGVNRGFSIKSLAKAFCNGVSRRLVIENVYYKFMFGRSGVFSLSLIALPMSVFFYKVKVDEVCLGLPDVSHDRFYGIQLEPVVRVRKENVLSLCMSYSSLSGLR